ncbi:hypothetical protein [Robiginitalea marina]|uniref:Chemotaxis protein n=1 Tax=Robiginitalea marina TaxID=2954105 RepID=A0ABT1AZX7_9FLAO|nr:hypothetical protein [Robiginitalea marina]MCO5725605.1 hypothetical protein [Robiginitalea marina]
MKTMLKTRGILLAGLIVLLLSSCSLVKIESEQKPLSVNELNTRLLIQAFAEEALERTEIAADSIAKEAEGHLAVQKNALRWKIQTASALGRISFQTMPRVALADTWSYMYELLNFFEASTDDAIFGSWAPIALEATAKNTDRIEKIATSVLNKKEYPRYREFVETYAREHPLRLENEFRHTPIREAYLAFKELPDSTAVQTVGTLSEVVADATNRFDYASDVAGKKFAWQTSLFLKEQGLDSIPLETRLARVEYELERLVEVAENSPEILATAIEDFRGAVNPIFKGLNSEISRAMVNLALERRALDEMILRERIALDTIIQRERLALGLDAREIADTGIKNAFAEIHGMLKSILFFGVIALIVVLGLPFYLGYLTGKRAAGSEKDSK